MIVSEKVKSLKCLTPVKSDSQHFINNEYCSHSLLMWEAILLFSCEQQLGILMSAQNNYFWLIIPKTILIDVTRFIYNIYTNYKHIYIIYTINKLYTHTHISLKIEVNTESLDLEHGLMS